MKFCSRCGNQIDDTAVFCPNCGNRCVEYQQHKRNESTGLDTAIKVFLLLGTVVMGLTFYAIPLAWCIPMTVTALEKMKRREPISLGFKICTLFFVSLIGGILMLVKED